MTCGPTAAVDPESFVHSKYIILWAINTISNNLHHWPFIAEAQQRGAKVVVVDPVRRGPQRRPTGTSASGQAPTRRWRWA